MPSFEAKRVALVVANHADRGGQKSATEEEVATGYFLTGDLVLTTGHFADVDHMVFRVRSSIGSTSEESWSDAKPVWQEPGSVDAMLLRTEDYAGDWAPPQLVRGVSSGTWEASGFANAAGDPKSGRRQTLPLRGSFGESDGQIEAPQLYLTAEQSVSDKWDDSWKGISGAPVFLTGGTDEGLVGIITDANKRFHNGLVALPASRLLDNIRFRSIVAGTPETWPPAPFCLVVTREGSSAGLVQQVAGMISGFRDADNWFQALHKHPQVLGVLDAVGSVEGWARMVHALARADCVVVDVTDFEPAVMLLLGIRSVLRRGVTISVARGDAWRNATGPPFNVQETRVLSYSDNEFHENVFQAVAEGVANMSKDANYLDLPAYDAVRGPRPETWTSGGVKGLLVLCPFSTDYSPFYEKRLRSLIKGFTGNLEPQRMVDLRSPRLVGQALYEQIRWAQRCVVDWTEWRPNVFFELGVRLACSEHDPLNIIDVRYVSGPLEQHRMLHELLDPVAYDRDDPHATLVDAVKSWTNPESAPSRSHKALPPSATFMAAEDSFVWQSDQWVSVLPHVEQRESAERIVSVDETRQPERLVLFSGNERFNAALRASAREKWIAAWLYLRHLASEEDAAEDDRLQADFNVLTRLTIDALASSPDPRHEALRAELRQLQPVETRHGLGVGRDDDAD